MAELQIYTMAMARHERR